MTGTQFLTTLEGKKGSDHFDTLFIAMLDDLQKSHPAQEMTVMLAGTRSLSHLKDAVEDVARRTLKSDPRGHAWELFADAVQYRQLLSLGDAAVRAYMEHGERCATAFARALDYKP